MESTGAGQAAGGEQERYGGDWPTDLLSEHRTEDHHIAVSNENADGAVHVSHPFRCDRGRPADSSLASSGPRFILTCPLGVRQAPPTTERPVELHVGEETVAANLRERVLRRVELLLGFEHFEIIGQPLAIAIGRMLYGLRERLHRRVLSRL